MTMIEILLLLACLMPVRGYRADQDRKDAAADLNALQGVWSTPANSKLQLQLLILDGKIGYQIKNPDAKGSQPLERFVALSDAKADERKGKRSFAIEIAKDVVYRVGIASFEKDRLGVTLDDDDAAIALECRNTRASTSADAKKLLGAWTVIEAELDGKKGTAKNIGIEEIAFQEDRYVLKAGGKEVLGSFYRIDAAQSPLVMDWFTMRANYVIPLIYELKDDELRLCHPAFGKEPPTKRPTRFDSKDMPSVVIRAKRAAK